MLGRVEAGVQRCAARRDHAALVGREPLERGHAPARLRARRRPAGPRRSAPARGRPRTRPSRCGRSPRARPRPCASARARTRRATPRGRAVPWRPRSAKASAFSSASDASRASALASSISASPKAPPSTKLATTSAARPRRPQRTGTASSRRTASSDGCSTASASPPERCTGRSPAIAAPAAPAPAANSRALQVVVEAVHGGDAVLLARRVVHPDRGGVGAEHARGGRRELAEQHVEVELAADRLGRAHERRLREPRLAQRDAHAREPEGRRRVVAAEVEQRELVRAAAGARARARACRARCRRARARARRASPSRPGARASSARARRSGAGPRRAAAGARAARS